MTSRNISAGAATALAMVSLVVFVPTAGVAQVIEIGVDGRSIIYAGPTQFTSGGATPLRRPAPIERFEGSTNGHAEAAAAAHDAGLSETLVEAVAWQESRFHSQAISRAGAIGDMQLLPATARALGVDPFVRAQNFRGGAAYLARLMHRYDGDLVKTLAAYNAGPGAVDRYGGVPPFRETRAYVAAILDRLSAPEAPSIPSTDRIIFK